VKEIDSKDHARSIGVQPDRVVQREADPKNHARTIRDAVHQVREKEFELAPEGSGERVWTFGHDVQNDSECLQVLNGCQMAAELGALIIHVDKA